MWEIRSDNNVRLPRENDRNELKNGDEIEFTFWCMHLQSATDKTES